LPFFFFESIPERGKKKIGLTALASYDILLKNKKIGEVCHENNR
jgi:hypothetical protein